MNRNFRYLHYAPSLFVILLLLVWQVNGQKSSPPRPAWEYKTIILTANFKHGLMTDWSEWAEDGTTLPLPVDMQTKLAKLGDQGWELVSAMPRSQNARLFNRNAYNVPDVDDNIGFAW